MCSEKREEGKEKRKGKINRDPPAKHCGDAVSFLCVGAAACPARRLLYARLAKRKPSPWGEGVMGLSP